MILNELFDDFGDSPGKQEEIPPIGVLNVIKYIKEHCSQFVQLIKDEKTLLYRGFSNRMNVLSTEGLYSKPFFIGQTQLNRKPVGLYSWQHDILVQSFKIVGFKASRDKTISCTSSFSEAKKFGKPFYIFPLNGFDYTWSTKFSDIGRIQADPYNIRDLKAQNFFNRLYDKNVDYSNSDKFTLSINTAKKIIQYFGFTDRNINVALDKRHEIAIKGRYIAINVDIIDSADLMYWLTSSTTTIDKDKTLPILKRRHK